MEIHLAAMENMSCWAFRKLCRGASNSYTGMLSLNNLVRRNNTWDEVDTYSIEGQKQWIQIATNKEKECAAFIAKLEEEIVKHPEKDNIYGIQINASCPSIGLINLGQGPALIKRPTKVGSLLRELLKQNKYKVGIKVRLGLNEAEVRGRRIFKLLAELEKIAAGNPNFTNVTIHFKHAQESSSSEYDYSLLNEIATYNLPLIINGGINNSQDIDNLMKMISPENKKNIKGIMIGRQAFKNPNCFIEINNAARGEDERLRSNEEIRKEFEGYCQEHMPKLIYLKTIGERSGMIGERTGISIIT